MCGFFGELVYYKRNAYMYISQTYRQTDSPHTDSPHTYTYEEKNI
jgi:hypothetical protein